MTKLRKFYPGYLKFGLEDADTHTEIEEMSLCSLKDAILRAKELVRYGTYRRIDITHKGSYIVSIINDKK